MFAANSYGIRLRNDVFKHEYVLAYDFDKIFNNRQSAIDFCIERNQQLKTKVYE